MSFILSFLCLSVLLYKRSHLLVFGTFLICGIHDCCLAKYEVFVKLGSSYRGANKGISGVVLNRIEGRAKTLKYAILTLGRVSEDIIKIVLDVS